MKRIVPVIVAALVLVGFLTRNYWWPAGTEGGYLGYVEGETRLIAPPTAGRLVERAVSRGEAVAKGTTVFHIDPAVSEAEVKRSEASLAEAEARLANLETGKRPEEQDVVRAQRREAEAALKLAEQDLARVTPLVKTGAATWTRYDQANAQLRQMRARVQSLEAQEAANDLGGRAAEIDAAEAQVRENRASLDQARARHRDLAPVAPDDALVEDTFFDVGEWVPAGQPVLSLLAPGDVRLRFFVPEAHVARAKPGTIVNFTCDGCPKNLEAAITYVSPRAEFTPPVIYSESARTKLVFMVEAKPTGDDATLRPGLPVEVTPLPEAKS